MKTIITERGQTVVPAEIRKRYKMAKGTRLAWLDNGQTITVIPLPQDPLEALYGCAKDEALDLALAEYRKEERSRGQ
ncbi:AbrB/MazE/SpoVT family DNA-binding domain-containing protein [bacterium]|nr:AbrB/MazE/SpoVT family DNA-binding domain-containing protein [bacterium]NCT20609.1 AbrB/MazE/SpoVT family DNA-binding domain-containing protein [bacterium]OIO85655.1 MAG: hypothetical protein AUK01_05395 [Anaerolineae bacterium CG2_30_57_67]